MLSYAFLRAVQFSAQQEMNPALELAVLRLEGGGQLGGERILEGIVVPAGRQDHPAAAALVLLPRVWNQSTKHNNGSVNQSVNQSIIQSIKRLAN